MTFEKENSITKTGKTRLLLIMIVAGAFIAGSLTTGPFAFAQLSQCATNPPHGIADGPIWGEVWTAICELEDRLDNITPGNGNVKHVTLEDGECVLEGGIFIGWCPGDNTQQVIIRDPDVTVNSVLSASITFPVEQGPVGVTPLQIYDIGENNFSVGGPYPDGTRLNYVVINP